MPRVCACLCVQESAAPKPLLLSELSVPSNAGRAYGALTADRNPIHLSSLSSQVRLGKTLDEAAAKGTMHMAAASRQLVWWWSQVGEGSSNHLLQGQLGGVLVLSQLQALICV